MNNPCASGQVGQNAIGANPVAVGTVVVKVLEVNEDRKEVIVQNVGASVIYLGLGFQPTATNYNIALQQCGAAHDGTGGVYVSDNWKGAIHAVSSVIGGLLAITEEL